MEKPHHYYRRARRAPKPTRIVVGVALVFGGLLGFLPILGFWMIPLGLAVIFSDVPWVRRQWLRLRLLRKDLRQRLRK